MSKPNQDPSHETRSRILEAAVKVFATKGYHDTKVDDIVNEAQTSKGSFYFYFPSKQDIFIALSDTFADLLESRLAEAIQSEIHEVTNFHEIKTSCIFVPFVDKCSSGFV